MLQIAPIANCDVERAFSRYGSILSNKRRSFLFGNLKKHFVLVGNPGPCLFDYIFLTTDYWTMPFQLADFSTNGVIIMFQGLMLIECFVKLHFSQ